MTYITKKNCSSCNTKLSFPGFSNDHASYGEHSTEVGGFIVCILNTKDAYVKHVMYGHSYLPQLSHNASHLLCWSYMNACLQLNTILF